MTDSTVAAAEMPRPVSFHADTLAERRALLAKHPSGDAVAVVWCWRNGVGGYFHPGACMWVTYSGPGLSLSDFLNYLERQGWELPRSSVIDAWCLAVREPIGGKHH